ncbi:ATP-binding protein [Quadrisphaera sp. INWT6]|uniref:sensor histidine kinase n=1 Tax=Quadrisphaera sp. INWT6 TaxID=2596917 RepID=UPI0018926024|nr:PAS domain-containing sensor histidine kinase [Quadrisphaera sp. INWT6]MBF5080399.1 PAS domain-containing sensor histidine kinase [Quadrisphaera sp. INWT6]
MTPSAAGPAVRATPPAPAATSGPTGDRAPAALLRRVRAATGWPSASLELVEHLLPTSLGALALERGSAVHLPDAAALPALATNPWVDGRLARTRAVACAPVTGDDGEVVAVLLARDGAPHPPCAAREEALADLADLASGVVAAARRDRALHGLSAAVAAADERLALAEIGLADRHDLLEGVLETVDVGIVVLDAGGRVQVVNPRARAWAGLPAGLDATGAARAATTALFADAQGTVLSAVRGPLLSALADGATTEQQVSWASPGGEVVTGVCRARPLLSGGERTGAVASLTDVTAERAARAELERSNAELESFAAVAAHDLRSPLTVVDGYLELLEEEAAERGDALAAGWSATARRGAGRMASLLEALLAHAAAGSARPPRLEPVPAGPLVEAVLADLAVPGGASVQVLGTDLPVLVGDPVHLHQLLTNLVGNALKFTRPGTPARVEVAVLESPSAWELRVVDHGPGVPADQRSAVFRAFDRGAHTARPAGGPAGHGLGLATAQRVAARHGGRIVLEDTPGGGLTARVQLPRP